MSRYVDPALPAPTLAALPIPASFLDTSPCGWEVRVLRVTGSYAGPRYERGIGSECSLVTPAPTDAVGAAYVLDPADRAAEVGLGSGSTARASCAWTRGSIQE